MTDEDDTPSFFRPAIRLLLTHGLAPLSALREWADGVILESASPSAWVVDTALARTEAEALSALGPDDPAPIPDAAWAILFAAWAYAVRFGTPDRVSQIALSALRLTTGPEVPESLDPLGLVSFWDDIDLAREGIMGVYEDVRGDFIEALFARANRLDGTAKLKAIVGQLPPLWWSAEVIAGSQ